MPENEAWQSTQAIETDDSDAHSIWCVCDECVEIIHMEMIEYRVPVK